jgi:hypothetical protein
VCHLLRLHYRPAHRVLQQAHVQLLLRRAVGHDVPFLPRDVLAALRSCGGGAGGGGVGSSLG